MAVELTFVNQYGETPAKRKRLAKACESCRSRKKRCVHFDDVRHDDTSERLSSASDVETEQPSSTQPKTLQRVFIGDTHPGSTLLHQAQPQTPGCTRQPNDVGIWVDRREWNALVQQKSSSTGAAIPSAPQSLHRPHSSVVGPLIDVYFRRIHPVLPIVDKTDLLKAHGEGTANETLVHAICLAAAKDAEAATYLRLEGSGILAPREFCSRLHATVVAALKRPSQFEKLTIIRALAITSLHAEGQDGGEEATLCLTQALHYSQTLGLHLGQQTGLSSDSERSSKLLFWCLWSLDRLYSCIYGRPIMMSDIDISIDSFRAGESGYPAFEVWLSICKTLNKLIGFYRPNLSLTIDGWEDDFPSFEDAIDEGHAWDLPQDQVATLHLFYLLVGVLTHRSRGIRHIRRSSPSYVRQSLNTLELKRLMSSQLFPNLLPLPLLPYAISLALSVSYQHLRQSQLQHQQEDARDDFRECYLILHKLQRTWCSADIIASIAKKVLDELNKATDLTTFRISQGARTGRASPGVCTASFARPHTLIDDRAAHAAAVATVDANDGANNAATDDGLALFDGVDDIFCTYLDPNYPVHFDDLSFMEDANPFDWNAVQS